MENIRLATDDELRSIEDDSFHRLYICEQWPVFVIEGIDTTHYIAGFHTLYTYVITGCLEGPYTYSEYSIIF